MKIDSFELAMLPVTYLLENSDPYVRYGNGSGRLDESYCDVLNSGVWGYQLYTYLLMVDRYFGQSMRNRVREHQLAMLGSMDDNSRSLDLTLTLIGNALDTSGISVPGDNGDINIPAEVNVALVLLLHDPASPDYVSDVDDRDASIRRMALDVDWNIAHCLAVAREDMVRTWSPLLAQFDLYPEAGLGLWNLVFRPARSH